MLGRTGEVAICAESSADKRCIRPSTVPAVGPRGIGIVTEREAFLPRSVPVTATDLVLCEPAAVHVHDFLELAFVTAGRAVHTSEAGTTLLHRGHVVVIAAGGWHAYRPEPKLHVVSVRVGVGVLRRVFPWVTTFAGIGYLFDVERSSSRPSTLVREIDLNTATTICPAIRALTHPPTAAHADLFFRLARLLDVLGGLDDFWSDRATLVDTTCATMRDSDDSDQPAQAAIGLLRARITEPWNLGRLAGEVHLSRSQVTRLFGASVGMGPMAYLRELRAQRMAELLRWTDISVTEAAGRVGWTDPNYASRCFRSRWEMSPSRFRCLSRDRPKTC